MNSIQRRLAIMLTGLCCLLWLSGSMAAYLMMRRGLINEFDFGRKADVDSLVNMTEQSEKGLKFDSTGEIMPAFQRAEHPDYFQLWRSDGSVLYRSPSLEENENLSGQVGTLQSPRHWNVALPDGQRGRAIGVVFTPKEDEDEPRTPGGPPLNKQVALVAAFHRGDLDRRLHYLGTVLLLVGAVMAGMSALLLGGVIRRGLRPLSSLAECATTIDAASLQRRFPEEDLPSELRPIAQRLNDLLQRLEASFTRERRFSANVAHELRTPIAELRALTEVALKWPENNAATQAALEDALAIALQMESTSSTLLALGRCESSLFTAKPESVSIPALFQETLSPLEARVRDKRLTVSIEIPPNACWFTDRVALGCIVSNLLTNAVNYTPKSGSIRVHLGKNGSSKTLSVSNTNDDLTSEDVSHLFERFWRKESARSSPLHSGLGLSLAKAYARSLAMELTAELNEREISFTLSVPKR